MQHHSQPWVDLDPAYDSDSSDNAEPPPNARPNPRYTPTHVPPARPPPAASRAALARRAGRALLPSVQRAKDDAEAAARRSPLADMLRRVDPPPGFYFFRSEREPPFSRGVLRPLEPFPELVVRGVDGRKGESTGGHRFARGRPSPAKPKKKQRGASSLVPGSHRRAAKAITTNTSAGRAKFQGRSLPARQAPSPERPPPKTVRSGRVEKTRPAKSKQPLSPGTDAPRVRPSVGGITALPPRGRRRNPPLAPHANTASHPTQYSQRQPLFHMTNKCECPATQEPDPDTLPPARPDISPPGRYPVVPKRPQLYKRGVPLPHVSPDAVDGDATTGGRRAAGIMKDFEDRLDVIDYTFAHADGELMQRTRAALEADLLSHDQPASADSQFFMRQALGDGGRDAWRLAREGIRVTDALDERYGGVGNPKGWVRRLVTGAGRLWDEDVFAAEAERLPARQVDASGPSWVI
jgi:hypothetical protein